MNRREKCRCISITLVFLLGVAGVVAFIYGGVNLYRVSREAAVTDNVESQMSPFFKCCDSCSALPNGNADPLCHLVKRNCKMTQAPTMLPFGFAAAFTILALLSAPCAFKKDQWFGFGILSSLTIACTLIAVVAVGFQAVPIVTTFADCSKFDANTISEVEKMNMICFKTPNASGGVDVKESVAKWMCKLCTFFGGAAVNVAAMLLFMFIKKCRCCNQPCVGANGCAERKCFFGRCFGRLRSRFCSRSGHSPVPADGMPESAPSYYDVSEGQPAPTEDAGSSPSSSYRAYGVQ